MFSLIFLHIFNMNPRACITNTDCIKLPPILLFVREHHTFNHLKPEMIVQSL